MRAPSSQCLPRFGGSVAVWATCLVFFQAALLVGYLYARLRTNSDDYLRFARVTEAALGEARAAAGSAGASTMSQVLLYPGGAQVDRALRVGVRARLAPVGGAAFEAPRDARYRPSVNTSRRMAAPRRWPRLPCC